MAIRKDNVEYHKGYSDFRDGVDINNCPYLFMNDLERDCRANRWVLGWNDAKADYDDRGPN